MTEAVKKAEASDEEFPSVTALTGNVNHLLTKYEPDLDGIVKQVGDIETGAADLLKQLNNTLGDNREAIDGIVEGRRFADGRGQR